MGSSSRPISRMVACYWLLRLPWKHLNEATFPIARVGCLDETIQCK